MSGDDVYWKMLQGKSMQVFTCFELQSVIKFRLSMLQASKNLEMKRSILIIEEFQDVQKRVLLVTRFYF